MKKLRTKVFCQNPVHGSLSFFLQVDQQYHFLFSTDFYSSSIEAIYSPGVEFELLYQRSSIPCQRRIQERILRMAHYLATEYGFELPPKRKIRKRRHRDALKRDASKMEQDTCEVDLMFDWQPQTY